MARDRQRAKARRKRAEGPPPKKRDKRNRPNAPLEGATPAPDPLEDSSPYVDEAQLAEAGADVPPPGETVDDDLAGADVPPAGETVDDELAEAPAEASVPEWFEEEGEDFERAPDEVEGDLLPSGVTDRANLDPAVAEEHHASGATVRTERKQRGRVLTFLGHVVDELRRVQWPNRRQVGQGTAVTLGFVVLAGGYLGLMDAIWKPLIEAIL
jgi:preprotein translocase SecE subunit